MAISIKDGVKNDIGQLVASSNITAENIVVMASSAFTDSVKNSLPDGTLVAVY